jgi:hypothetical protein
MTVAKQEKFGMWWVTNVVTVQTLEQLSDTINL